MHHEDSDWSLAHERCSGAPFMNWTAARPPSSSPLEGGWAAVHGGDSNATDGSAPESCVTITGSTGVLHKEEVCDWPLQCLCELGAQDSTAYLSTMKALAEVRQGRADRLRMVYATIFSAAIGLPLFFDRRTAQMGQWVRNWHSGKPSLMSTIAVHTGWALVVVGFAPFILETLCGAWDAAQLGSWPNYSPIGPWGAGIIALTMRPSDFHLVCWIFSGLYLLVGVMCGAYAYGAVAQDFRPLLMIQEDLGTPHHAHSHDDWLHVDNLQHNASNQESLNGPVFFCMLCFFVVSGVVNIYHGARMIVSSLRPGMSPALICKEVSYGRVISGISGALLLAMAISAIFLDDSPQVAREHPYSAGVVLTGFSWVAYGLFGGQQRMSYWLGTASNGLVHAELPYSAGVLAGFSWEAYRLFGGQQRMRIERPGGIVLAHRSHARSEH